MDSHYSSPKTRWTTHHQQEQLQGTPRRRASDTGATTAAAAAVPTSRSHDLGPLPRYRRCRSSGSSNSALSNGSSSSSSSTALYKYETLGENARQLRRSIRQSREDIFGSANRDATRLAVENVREIRTYVHKLVDAHDPCSKHVLPTNNI